jgi:hypothetical protein
MFSFFPNICFSIFCASNFVPIFFSILFQQLISKIFQMRCLPSLCCVSEIFFWQNFHRKYAKKLSRKVVFILQSVRWTYLSKLCEKFFW